MAAMFVNLKQKLQSLSPIGSPVGSPNASPKPRRRFAFKTPARMKQRREEFREVQSDPECDYESTRKQKRKSTSSSTKQKQYYEDLYDVPPKPRRKSGSSYFSPKAQSQTLGRMEGKKQVQRLAQYERYFQDLLAETSADHPDVDDLGRVRARVSQLVSASAAEHCELDRVQDLFPSDNLGLYHRDPTYPRMKGLIRKRSAPATRLQRALSAKTLRPTTADPAIPTNVEDARDSAMPSDAPEPPSKRQFIMESAVQFTLALQSQERHLFLFSDMLLVAKARSGGNFKLKDKLRLSEMWLSGCLDEVTEATKDPSTSFVLGWPTTNVVATFSCSAARDLWYNKLSQMMVEERQTEPKATTIRVVYFDQLNNIDFCKTMSVDCSMTARDCVRTALTNLEMTEASAADYQLWVRTGHEDAPYPLIGHELPLAIKMNLVREYLAEDGGCGPHTATEMDHCNNIYNGDATLKCQFILRHVRKGVMTPSPGVNSASKKKKPLRKSPIRIHKVFRRTNSKCDSVDSAISACNSGLLFGQPLSTLCQHEPIPKPVLDMLMQIFMIGPFTVGIFRKSANARLVKEFREKLDTELDVNVESVNICVIACLVKDFLRSLPDAVLGSDLYDEWRELTEVEDDVEKVHRVRELCSRLPAANVTLLCHFLCVLHHIALRSRHNLMSPANLAVCVGPSLLSPGNPAQVMTAEHSKLLPAVVEFLIDKCAAIFGPECLTLFGPAPDKEMRTDSGAEESDSVNSSGGVRRDDSSIDSLERELLGENEPLPRKDKMSVTNLSRDSGLTMSDTQLYTPDEEESASNSSGHSGSRTAAEKPGSAYSSGRGSDRHIVSYSAPNNPNAIYAAIYRRRHQLGPTYSSPSQTTPAGCGQLTDYGSSAHARSYSPSADVTFEDVLYAHPPTRRINSNFQRQDWTRQRHLLRRSANSGSSGKSSVTPPPGKSPTQRQLRRSTSEESLLNGCYSTAVGRQYGGSVTRIGVPASLTGHSGAAEEPAGHGCRYSRLYQTEMEEQSLPTMLRSKSAHHIVEKRAVATTKAARLSSAVNSEWLRSRSTPHFDEVDRSYDSSTLSDDDSTPHVSRSNSRTKDCALANDLWERAYGSTLDNRSEDSGSYTSRTGSFSTIRSTGTVRSVDTTPGATCTPPSYEATLSRRGWLQHKPSLSEGRARQLYGDSLRVNEQQKGDVSMADAMHHASPVRAVEAAVDGKYPPPPLPPKTEAPPLPPKQKTPLKRVGPQMSSGGSSGRLKQLPPVHVETTAWKSRGNGSVYIRTGEAVSGALHEAPALPPKERTVIQIESDYVAPSVVRPQRPKRRVSKREVQTQTDDEPTLDGDEVALSVRAPHVTLVEIECRGPLAAEVSPVGAVGPSERRGRNRRRDRQQRARSQPASCDDDQSEEPETTLEWSQQHDDPSRTQISWSVSRLRAMFSTQSADDASSDSGRHPPLRRTSVGLLLNGDAVYAQPAQLSTAAPSRPAGRRRADSGGSGYGEESYV